MILSQPILDIVIYATRLSAAIGAQGPATMLGYLVVSGAILTRYAADASSGTAVVADASY